MNQISSRLETILNEAQRKALVAVLRARPELTLKKLQDCFAGRYGDTLQTITVRELLESDLQIDLPPDGGPPIDPKLLELAKQSYGDAYDALVYGTIVAARGRRVSAGYLRVRVGGPRWKLQGSLKRLADAGRVVRRGVTSSTRYRATAAIRD